MRRRRLGGRGDALVVEMRSEEVESLILAQNERWRRA
jgi:hypothetical protein